MFGSDVSHEVERRVRDSSPAAMRYCQHGNVVCGDFEWCRDFANISGQGNTDVYQQDLLVTARRALRWYPRVSRNVYVGSDPKHFDWKARRRRRNIFMGAVLSPKGYLESYRNF